MLLKKIIIQNYRSIDHLEIEISDIAGCRFHTFFGINETGKSNILKAISLLNPNRTVSYNDDCNKNAKKYNKPIFIKYVFEISDLNRLHEQINSATEDSEYIDLYGVEQIEKIVYFDEKSNREDYYGTLPSKRDSEYFGLAINSTALMETYTRNLLTSIDVEDTIEIDSQVAPDVTSYAVVTNPFVISLFDSLIPEVIFWEPSAEHLIINPINLEQFKRNPDISIPLKHIFQLCGFTEDNLTSNITRIQNDVDTRMEFEDELSDKITNHINEIWTEHSINIRVRMENNDFCSIYVEDKDNVRQKFNMSQRSDGFKQFISILLSLSVKNTTNQLKNKIILLDEPERSLHPGSIKCLRDELLKISKKNIVLSSSHSIFMVDKKNLERHYTVTKNDSKTVIEQVDPESPIQDEVIYNALGTSIFELLEENMLIFEGKTDKDIFNAFTLKLKEEIQPVKIQAISATGADRIPKYIKFFHNKLFNGFVVVDSDKDGRKALQSIRENDVEFSDSIFELKQLVEIEKTDITLEDVLPESLVLSCANERYEYIFESPNDKPILNHIKDIKKENSIETDWKLKDLKEDIVKTVLEDVQSMELEALKQKYGTYIEMIINLHNNIKEVNV